MSPLRLLILAILFYVVYRLLVGGKGNKEPESQQQRKTYREMPVDDTLEEDPVCKKLVPRQQAVHYRHGDHTIYFCSEECCQKFISQEGEH